MLKQRDQDKILKLSKDFGGAKCPKFNLVGPVELDNLKLAKLIAKSVGKKLRYKMVDFHSSRPGHDLRYALDGNLMERLGWKPIIEIDELIEKIVNWEKNHSNNISNLTYSENEVAEYFKKI